LFTLPEKYRNISMQIEIIYRSINVWKVARK
jgi:hypothetical protein